MFQHSIHTRESNDQIKSYIIEFFIPTICARYAYRLHLYLKTRLQHRCFLLYFVKYSRIAFCKKTLGNCFFTWLWPGYFRNIISISSTFGGKFFTNSNIDISPVAFGTSRNLIRKSVNRSYSFRYHFWRSNIYNSRTSESKMCHSFFSTITNHQILMIYYVYLRYKVSFKTFTCCWNQWRDFLKRGKCTFLPPHFALEAIKLLWNIRLRYQPLLRQPTINAGPFYAGLNSATLKIWLNPT